MSAWNPACFTPSKFVPATAVKDLPHPFKPVVEPEASMPGAKLIPPMSPFMAPVNVTADGTTQCWPFKVYLFHTETSDEINVCAGTINQFIPENMLDTFPYSPLIPAYVILTVTTNGRTVTGATLSVVGTKPPATGAAINAGPATFYVVIAVVLGSSVDQVVTGNLTATLRFLGYANKTTPVDPGRAPFDFVYTWLV